MNENNDYLQVFDNKSMINTINGKIITGYNPFESGHTIALGPPYSYYDGESISTKSESRFDITWEKKIEESKLPSKFPEVRRVIFNDNVTVVFFDDDSKVIVKKSKGDKYDKEHAVVYAIIKRLWGEVNPDKTVSSNGFMQKLKRIVKAGEEPQKARKAKSKKA